MRSSFVILPILVSFFFQSKMAICISLSLSSEKKRGGVSWNVLFKWTSLILLDVKSDRDRFESVQSSRPSQKSVSGFVGLRAFAEVNHTISRCDLHVEAIEGGTDDNTWNLWVPVYFLDLTLTMMSK